MLLCILPLALTISKHTTMVHNVIFLQFLLVVFGINIVASANIFDLLWHENDSVEKRDESVDDSETQKSCTCSGPSCMCCVDFNITFIDLGGPGCVHMKYLSQEDGVSLNVSYGDSLLHNGQVKGLNPEPVCISLLTNLAQVCARFSNLEPHDDGLKGCLLLEPQLLGDAQAQFDVGCFIMGPEGMKLDPDSNSSSNQIENENNGSSTESETDAFNEEDLIAAVNESAEKGLVYFGNLLGLAFGKISNDTEAPPQPSTDSSTPGTTSADTGRKSKEISPKLNSI